MLVTTRLFGEIEIEDAKVLEFPSGLVGMKPLKRFVILDTEREKPFRWLQSLDDAEIAFLTLEPRLVRPDYRITVGQEELLPIGITPSTEILVLCIVTIYRDPRTLTANLQGPLLINAENRRGKQLILVDSKYNNRHDILKEIAALKPGTTMSNEGVLDIKTR